MTNPIDELARQQVTFATAKTHRRKVPPLTYERVKTVMPRIVVDSREQDPLPFFGRTVTRTLETGDYSFVGGLAEFAVERKSVEDLVACVVASNRDRFERELRRLRAWPFRRLLIVGEREDILAGNYRSRVSPTSVLHSLDIWGLDTPVVWKSTPREAANYVVDSARWYARRQLRRALDLAAACSFDEWPEDAY